MSDASCDTRKFSEPSTPRRDLIEEFVEKEVVSKFIKYVDNNSILFVSRVARIVFILVLYPRVTRSIGHFCLTVAESEIGRRKISDQRKRTTTTISIPGVCQKGGWIHRARLLITRWNSIMNGTFADPRIVCSAFRNPVAAASARTSNI